MTISTKIKGHLKEKTDSAYGLLWSISIEMDKQEIDHLVYFTRLVSIFNSICLTPSVNHRFKSEKTLKPLKK